MHTDMKPKNPLAAWKRRHRRNRTRLLLIEADWPGMQATCEKIAALVHQFVKPSEMAELAIDQIFEKAFETYLNILNKPSHSDHERLVAFIASALAMLREETAIEGHDEELLQRFVRPEFWWIFIPKATDEARLIEESEGHEDTDLPVVEEIR